MTFFGNYFTGDVSQDSRCAPSTSRQEHHYDNIPGSQKASDEPHQLITQTNLAGVCQVKIDLHRQVKESSRGEATQMKSLRGIRETQTHTIRKLS